MKIIDSEHCKERRPRHYHSLLSLQIEPRAKVENDQSLQKKSLRHSAKTEAEQLIKK
jgi:hypothetical protein